VKIAAARKVKMKKTKKNTSADAASKVITKETKLNEILEKKPEVASVLFDIGLGCAGCHFSSHETLEEGCLGHGFNEEEIEEIVKMLNAEVTK
jgi:hybrid cluster-associated redox disulfide protein